MLNLASWAWWRLYQLPFRIVKTCALDMRATCFERVCAPKGLVLLCPCSPISALLIALCLMHAWWLYLLLRIAHALVRPAREDGRVHAASKDEYEGSSDDEQGKED